MSTNEAPSTQQTAKVPQTSSTPSGYPPPPPKEGNKFAPPPGTKVERSDGGEAPPAGDQKPRYQDRFKDAFADNPDKTKPAEQKPAEGKETAPADTGKPESQDSGSLIDRVKPKEGDATGKPVENPEDKLSLPANASEASQAGWKQLKAIAKTEREAKLALQQQLETYKNASPVDAAQVEHLKKEHQSALDRLAVLDLKSHPDFVKQYVEPKNNALNEAKEVLGYNGKEAGDLAGLLAKPVKDFNAAVSELTKDMNSMDATTVQTALRNAHRLQAGEANALSKSSELAQALQQRTAAVQKQAFEETAKKFHGENPFLAPFPDRPDATPEQRAADQRYNESVAGVRQLAEQYAFGGKDERGMAEASYKAATLDIVMQHVVPRLQSEFSTLRQQYTALAKEYEALKGNRSPSALNGDSSGGPAKEVGYQQKFAKAFGDTR